MTACKDCIWFRGDITADRCAWGAVTEFDYMTGKNVLKCDKDRSRKINLPLCMNKNQGDCPDFAAIPDFDSTEEYEE